MTHQRMMDRAPSCVILHNKNELKIYQGNIVYLNDGDNFELRFFNPLQEKIGIEILFNSTKKGDGYLILNPGQDLILDRFLDEQRKMLFETYVVDGNNEAAVKAIEENGVINFNFYKEYHRSGYIQQNEVNIKYDFAPKPSKPYWNNTTGGNTYITNNYYGSGTTGYSGRSGTSGSSGVSGVAGAAGYSGTGCGGTYTSLNLNATGTIPMQQDYWFPSTTSTGSVVMDSINFSEYLAESTEKSIDYNDYIQQNLSNPLETGRIEKGEISNQKLKNVNAQFAPIPFHSITYKIMPYSSMNRTIGEVRQYCPECGYRIRKENWKFCPKCGEKIM